MIVTSPPQVIYDQHGLMTNADNMNNVRQLKMEEIIRSHHTLLKMIGFPKVTKRDTAGQAGNVEQAF